VQKIPSSGVLLYVVALNFYGGKAFFGKFMVVRVRLWSNTNLERGEAPIGQIPVWAVHKRASLFLPAENCPPHLQQLMTSRARQDTAPYSHVYKYFLVADIVSLISFSGTS
jgi:hypothetical protein